MSIEINLDVMLAKRKMKSNELALRIGLSENSLSRIKTGKIHAIRFSTLEAICLELDCEPGDILLLRHD
ncbi:MAG: helix-turn-helix transcriptional regulator [Adlercreutzia sp.]|uniref:helix-turn-helix domain-containing protein n=1 Tax=uncultured Adlercreutzia sp. TaxID=875803 RepID=UPI00217342DA|nr:helix-turn-helix transcriptional regulator [uncultured Adlercreutzia sp.]MCI8424248.1 helix-turn-helix transcriptional regulator [Adlercreutzia sp.]